MVGAFPTRKGRLIACVGVVTLITVVAGVSNRRPSSDMTSSTRLETEREPTAHLSLVDYASPEISAVVESLGVEHKRQLSLVELRKEAHVQYLRAKFKRDENKIRHYVDLAWEHADAHEMLEPELILAVIQKESSLRPKAKSSYGAVGLMQVVPRFHREKFHKTESLYDPQVNIRVGAQILSEYWHRSGRNWHVALKKYSGNAKGYPESVLAEAENLAAISDRISTVLASN